MYRALPVLFYTIRNLLIMPGTSLTLPLTDLASNFSCVPKLPRTPYRYSHELPYALPNTPERLGQNPSKSNSNR